MENVLTVSVLEGGGWGSTY